MIMKKIFLNIIWALAIFSLAAACDKTPEGGENGEGGNNNTPKEYVWHFKALDASETQNLGLFIRDFEGGLTNGEIHLDASSGASFEVKTDYPLSTGGKIYAYAPYNAETSDHKAVKMSIPAEQTFVEVDMPRVAVPLVLDNPKPDSTIILRMVDIAATLTIKVFSTQNTGERIKSISFTADSPVAGNFVFNIKDADPNQAATMALSGYDLNTVSVAANQVVGTDAEGAQAIPMVLAPGSYTGTITVTTSADVYGVVVETPVVLTRASETVLTVRIAPRNSQDDNGSTEVFVGGELVTE